MMGIPVATAATATTETTEAARVSPPAPLPHHTRGYTDHFIDVCGHRVHYLVGQALAQTAPPPSTPRAEMPPLILLHGGGLGSAALTYEASIGAFAAHGRVIALDWPGYGASDKPDVPYTTDWYIGFLADCLDALGIAQADLCGLSMGGAIALGFALRCPLRVRKLVLVNSHGFGQGVPCHIVSNLVVRSPWLNTLGWWGLRRHETMMRRSLRPALRYPESVTDALIAEAIALVRDRGTVRAWRRWQRSEIGWNGFRTNYSPRLPTLAAATLILHSALDTVVPMADAARAYRAIPDCRLRVFPHCGHWMMRDDPAAFLRAVAEFLALASAPDARSEPDAVSSAHGNPVAATC